jgi:hypothetical protein
MTNLTTFARTSFCIENFLGICAGFLKVCQLSGFVKASPAIGQDRRRVDSKRLFFLAVRVQSVKGQSLAGLGPLMEREPKPDNPGAFFFLTQIILHAKSRRRKI